ncbi:MAG: hypothetical protein VX561_01615 [Pseudomonadota bacterium]|nr:hypothetical protein [Pseudomonadota bacterium]
MLHMPSPMLLQAADGADPRAEAYIAAVGTFTAARAAIVRKLFADMGAAADKLRFLYLCAAHDQSAATRNVMDPANNPLTAISNYGGDFIRSTDRYIQPSQQYYAPADESYLIYPTYTYGSRTSGLGGGNLFVGTYLAPRASATDGTFYFQAMFNPPATLFFSNGQQAAKRTQVNWPGQASVYHGPSASTSAGGFLAVGRSGANSVGWVDGAPADSPQNTGQPTINFGQTGARGYISASPVLRIAIHCLGEEMTDAEVATLNTAFRNYLTSIGAPLA